MKCDFEFHLRIESFFQVPTWVQAIIQFKYDTCTAYEIIDVSNNTPKAEIN